MSRTATAARPSADQNAVQSFVNREVFYCVSSLVSELAGTLASPLGEQAVELCSPLADYDEAAREAGFEFYPTSGKWHAVEQAEDPDEAMVINFESAEEVCREQDLDPSDREVFEHWIVSDWLAEKLAAHGEKVDTDFAGMTVWARTTTGQGIASDGVIERIYDELHSGSEG